MQALTLKKTANKTGPRKIAVKALTYLFLSLFAAVLILPFISLVSTSFKGFEQAVSETANLIPRPFILENYKLVFTEHGFATALLHSLHLSLIPVAGILLSSSLVAYAFARFEVREKEVIFSFLLMSVMIPGQVLQISMYALYVKLDWLNTFLPFWIPPFLGGGIMNVFLIRQFFRGIPKSLFEAAEIDGCNELRMCFTIAMRLSSPVLITIAIFTFTGSWNDFMGPLLYLNSKPELHPLALAMYKMYDRLKIGDTKQWNIITAANVLTMLPLIALFFGMQKYFIEGISLSGVKQ